MLLFAIIQVSHQNRKFKIIENYLIHSQDSVAVLRHPDQVNIVATANYWLFSFHGIHGTIILEFWFVFFFVRFTQWKCNPYSLCFHIASHTNHSQHNSFLFLGIQLQKLTSLRNCCFTADGALIDLESARILLTTTKTHSLYSHSSLAHTTVLFEDRRTNVGRLTNARSFYQHPAPTTTAARQTKSGGKKGSLCCLVVHPQPTPHLHPIQSFIQNCREFSDGCVKDSWWLRVYFSKETSLGQCCQICGLIEGMSNTLTGGMDLAASWAFAEVNRNWERSNGSRAWSLKLSTTDF